MRRVGTAAIVALLAGVAWLVTGPAHAQSQTPNINLLQDTPSKTPEEVEAAKSAGFASVGLGPRILRTETAALVTLSILGFALGDLG